MKVIFEMFDTVQVQDNEVAGELSSEFVELLEKVSKTEWKARSLTDNCGKLERVALVNEAYLIP